MLEEEEMKQLLKKTGEIDQTTEMLNEDDKELMSGLFKEPLDNAAKAMAKVLGKPAEVTELSVDIAKASLIKETLGEEYCLIDATYKTGLSTFAFDLQSVKKIASVMLETLPEEGPLSETEKNSFDEIFSQMVVAIGRSLSKAVEGTVEPEASTEESKIAELDENVLQFSIGLKINDDINTTAYYYISYGVVNALIKVLKTKLPEEVEEPEKKETAEKKVEEDVEESAATVQPIRFEELAEDLVADEKENMNLLMDLQLQISVELGKVKKPIKDILQFTQGTIVELDRLAGENVDILVSGKIIAKGEVVVVDQNFGVRITKIVLPEKRV